jgi:hypothetical protein
MAPKCHRQALPFQSDTGDPEKTNAATKTASLPEVLFPYSSIGLAGGWQEIR